MYKVSLLCRLFNDQPSEWACPGYKTQIKKGLHMMDTIQCNIGVSVLKNILYHSHKVNYNDRTETTNWLNQLQSIINSWQQISFHHQLV